MLNQIDIYFKKTQDISCLYSDLSIKLHGFIMSKIPDELAREYHEMGLRPFSIYTVDTPEFIISRVSCLNQTACEIIKVFKNKSSVSIFGLDNNLEIADVRIAQEVNLLELASAIDFERMRITFLTPAAYKSGGRHRHDPCLWQYFNSVIKKLHKYEGFDITKEQMNSAFNDIYVHEFDFTTKDFMFGGRNVTGMVGFANIQVPRNSEYLSIIRMLLSYATYAGVGGGTTQGMGGFVVEKL